MQVATTPELKHTTSAVLARGGSANIIGLDVIKREAGARWEKMRDTIYQRIESILRQKLGPSDFFIQIDEISYLVTIPAAEPEDAQVCCLRVAYELHTSLLGPCTIAQLRIARAATRDEDTLEVTPIVTPQIQKLAERAGIPQLVSTKPSEDGANPAARRMRHGGTPVSFRDELVHRFVPIWDARAEAISAYRCVVEPVEAWAESGTPHARALAALRIALATLDHAVSALVTHIARGERFLVHARVSYETLTSPVARMEFVSACRALSHELRPYLVFEIADLPVGVPQSRMNELVTTVRPFGRAVTAEVAPRNPTLSMYQGIGLQAIGLQLGAAQDPLAKTEIERLAAAAKRLGLLSFLNEVPSTVLVEFARGAGVQWMSGPAIAKPVGEPGPMIRLYTDEILRRTRTAAG